MVITSPSVKFMDLFIMVGTPLYSSIFLYNSKYLLLSSNIAKSLYFIFLIPLVSLPKAK